MAIVYLVAMTALVVHISVADGSEEGALWIKPPPETAKSSMREVPIFLSSLKAASSDDKRGARSSQSPSDSALSRPSRSGDQLAFTVFRSDFSRPNYGRLAAASRDNLQVLHLASSVDPAPNDIARCVL